MTNGDAKDIYDRLRATEQETAVQAAKLEACMDRLDAMIKRMDRHWDNLWRVVFVLIGALVSLALGPKVAEKIAAGFSGNTVTYNDICPWHGDRHGWTTNKAVHV